MPATWGHCLKIFRPDGREEGMVKQKVLAMFPTFELYEGDRHLGHVRREFTPFKPSYEIDFNGWHVKGNFMEWDYTITGANGERRSGADRIQGKRVGGEVEVIE